MGIKLHARVPMKMNAAQEQALRNELTRQVVAENDKYEMAMDACTLWTLYHEFGWGQKRLRRFFEACLKEHRRLRERYQLDPRDDGWLYGRLLERDAGVKIEDWYKEVLGDTDTNKTYNKEEFGNGR